MSKRIFLGACLLSIGAILSGCATRGGGIFNTNLPEDAGAAPQRYEQGIQQFLRLTLKDPGSMTDFSTSTPMLTSCAVGVYGAFHGWRVNVSYNAKNSYGGYVGLKTYYYWFHGDSLKGIGENPTYCPEAPSWR